MGASVEARRCPRVGRRGEGGIAQARTGRDPGGAPVGALEDAATRARVESGRRLGVDGQDNDSRVWQATVGGAPGGAAVSALVDTADVGTSVEGGWRLGVGG